MKTFKFGLLVNIIGAATGTRVTVGEELHVNPQTGKPGIIIQIHDSARNANPMEQMLRELMGAESIRGLVINLGENLTNKITYPGFPEGFQMSENHEIISKCTVYGVEAEQDACTLEIDLVEE